MHGKEIIAAISHFKEKQIIVIGDVMVDAYLRGKVERISPEAPIPVVSVSARENRMGGAANVALNIQSLGATPILCSVIGKDDYSDVFMKLMEDAGISNQGIIKASERKTTAKTRVISNNQHLLRVDDEQSDAISEKLQKQLVGKIETICSTQNIDAIIFEDYDKGVITPNLILSITEIAKKYNIITTVDPKRKNFDAYKNVTLFKPNFKEFCEGMNCTISNNEIDRIRELSIDYTKQNNIKSILITLSENGVFAQDANGSYHIFAEKRDISDVSGAGDTVISAATLCLTVGLSIHHTASISNLAGGLVCERSGVVPIDLKELISEIGE